MQENNRSRQDIAIVAGIVVWMERKKVNVKRSTSFRALLPQHNPPLWTYLDGLHVARDPELFSLAGKYSLSNHFYRAGVVLNLEVFHQQERGPAGNGPVDRDLLVFVLPWVIENVPNFGGSKLLDRFSDPFTGEK